MARHRPVIAEKQDAPKQAIHSHAPSLVRQGPRHARATSGEHVPEKPSQRKRPVMEKTMIATAKSIMALPRSVNPAK
jgi:hypothetical protein